MVLAVVNIPILSTALEKPKNKAAAKDKILQTINDPRLNVKIKILSTSEKRIRVITYY